MISLGWLWPAMEVAMLVVFFVGGLLSCSKERRVTACRLMATSALCAAILAFLYVFSPDAPIIISSPMGVVNTIGGWIDDLVKQVLGG